MISMLVGVILMLITFAFANYITLPAIGIGVIVATVLMIIGLIKEMRR